MSVTNLYVLIFVILYNWRLISVYRTNKKDEKTKNHFKIKTNSIFEFQIFQNTANTKGIFVLMKIFYGF